MADWNIGSLVLTDNPGHLLGPGSVLLSEHAWQSEHTNTQEKKKEGGFWQMNRKQEGNLELEGGKWKC